MALWGSLRGALEAALDALAPQKARVARTSGRRLEDIPLKIAEHELLEERITTILEYRESAVQDLIRALKYDGSGAAAAKAAAALSDFLREDIASARAFSPREILLVPIPLHPSRRRARGFNQIELVLKALPKEFQNGALASLAPEVLARTKATAPQTKLPRRERLKNVADAFEARDLPRLKNAHVYLLDDVATTGATLTSAGQALAKAGAKVSLVALARA